MADLRVWRCDRCGYEMIERHCKVICPNCGARWDCSDVTIWVGDARAALRTRPYRASDYAALARTWRDAPAGSLQDLGGGAWVLLEGDALRGYAALWPLPGLPALYQLQGQVQEQACAVGAEQLLKAVLQGADRQRVRQISYGVDSLESSAARFLLAHGFRLEHEEWQMQAALPPAQPLRALPAGYTLCTLPVPQAVDRFLQLYEECFKARPWYQPYSRTELAAELHSAGDLLFVCREGTAVAFAWLRLDGAAGEIEPIGVAPAQQGMGMGHALFSQALWRLSERGARQVSVGVWRENEAAVALYRSAGLRPAASRYYLAYDLA